MFELIEPVEQVATNDERQDHPESYEVTYQRRAFLTKSGILAAALAATGLAASVPAAAAAALTVGRNGLLSSGLDSDLLVCMCAADDGVVSLADGTLHNVSFSGFLAARAETEFVHDGTSVLPLTIEGHTTQGLSSTLGQVRVSHDFQRPAPFSFVREAVPGGGFPAVQEMYVNILVEVEKLPGVVLRNVRTAVLRNNEVQSLPPSNAAYTLLEPMDLELTDKPGTTIATIVSYTALINPQR